MGQALVAVASVDGADLFAEALSVARATLRLTDVIRPVALDATFIGPAVARGHAGLLALRKSTHEGARAFTGEAANFPDARGVGFVGAPEPRAAE